MYPPPIHNIVYKSGISKDLTDEQWKLLALACLDQAGRSIREQEYVAELTKLGLEDFAAYFDNLERDV